MLSKCILLGTLAMAASRDAPGTQPTSPATSELVTSPSSHPDQRAARAAGPGGHVLHACVMSDRLDAVIQLMTSVNKTTKSTVFWHVFTSNLGERNMLGELSKRGVPIAQVKVFSLLEAEQALKDRGILPVWLWSNFSSVANRSWTTQWSLREDALDKDEKHHHPLNLLRFYLAELPMLEHLDKLILLDDDVCVQHDLAGLYESKGTGLLQANCELFARVDEEAGRSFELRKPRSLTYGDTRFIGLADLTKQPDGGVRTTYPTCNTAESIACTPSELEPLLLRLYEQITNRELGQQRLRQAPAWNFGLTVLKLDRWRSDGVAALFQKWCVANEKYHMFRKTSVSFGLGIPYMMFAEAVDCFPEATVLEGLGFLSWKDLTNNGDRRLASQTALHFTGQLKEKTCDVAELEKILTARRPSHRMLVDAYTTDWCSAGVLQSATSKYCCHSSCGSCGGSGCNSRPGGGSNCCHGSINTAGVACTDPATSVACIIPSS